MSQALKFTDERIRAMLDGRRAVRRVPFPGLGKDDLIGIRILTGLESDAARLEATERVRAETEASRLTLQARMILDPEVVDLQIMRNIVRLAIVHAEPNDKGEHTPFFPGAQAVDALPVDVVNALYEAYRSVEDLVNPEAQSKEELDAALLELKKSPMPEVHVLALPPGTRTSLLLTLLQRWSPS